jgi:Outer membrane protein beta-barrel domain
MDSRVPSLSSLVRFNIAAQSSIMRKLSSLIAFVVFVIGPRAAAAQASAATQTMPVPIIGIGGGISIPAGGISKNRQAGFNLDAMAEFRTPSEPLGLRGEVLYQYFGKDQNAANATSANTLGFLVNVVYHAPKSQVRPYLIGGMGLYHVSDNGNSAGFNVGTGLTIPLTGMGAYAEARLHFALTQGPSFVTIPITFGITF